jgi:hypothetical protein
MKIVFAAIAALTLAAPLHAQQAYGSISGDYALAHGADESDLLLTILGGVVSTGAPLAVGVEAELGLALGSGSDFNTRRLRGVARYDLGTLTGFGTVGFDQFVFDANTDNAISLSIGGEFDLQDNIGLRGELIRSFITSGATPDTTTTRVGMVYRF